VLDHSFAQFIQILVNIRYS